MPELGLAAGLLRGQLQPNESPAFVDALVAEVFGDGLAGDLADLVVGECGFVELEAAEICAEEDGSPAADVRGEAAQ